MSLRDRLSGEKPESITFDFTWEWADVDVSCSRRKIVWWLYNLINIANAVSNQIELDDEEKEELVNKRMSDLKDLFLNDEEWVS